MFQSLPRIYTQHQQCPRLSRLLSWSAQFPVPRSSFDQKNKHLTEYQLPGCRRSDEYGRGARSVEHNTIAFHKSKHTLQNFQGFSLKAQTLVQNATPPVAYTQQGRCVYWLQEGQAELLQLQVQAPGRQEQLSGELISEVADMYRMNTYLELQVHGLAIVI